MKILAIISSYRKNGHTSKIVGLLKKEVESKASKDGRFIAFEKLFLGDYEINHCKGCRVCMERGEQYCPLKDDVPVIKEKMDDADAVIFASPVYVGDLSSSMKALMDRLAYICHRPEFYDKCAIILATTNATSLKRTIRTMGAATYSWGFKTLGTQGFKTTSSNDSIKTLKKRYKKVIRKLAKKLYSGVKKKSYLNPSVISLAAFKLQQKGHASETNACSVDYEYWNHKGWVNSDRQYYIEVDISSMKLLISKVLYGIFSLVF